MATENKTAVNVFTSLDDEIRASRGNTILPGGDELSDAVKAYGVGGKNQMNTHPTENHTLYILQGQDICHA